MVLVNLKIIASDFFSRKKYFYWTVIKQRDWYKG